MDASRNAALGYDLAGNLTTKTKASGTRTFAWDARGALASVSESGAPLGRYDYDATGLRVKRNTASETVEYVLDDGHVLQEADGALPAHPSTRRYHYGYGPLSVTDTNGKRFIQTDALGSPTDLTSTSGAIASMRKHDAWGQYRNDSAPTAADEKLGYTGHQYDPETGLVYARARYYDPEVGAFISRDSFEGTLADAPSLHRFAYARLNPLRFTDPDGHASWEQWLEYLQALASPPTPSQSPQFRQAGEAGRAVIEQSPKVMAGAAVTPLVIAGGGATAAAAPEAVTATTATVARIGPTVSATSAAVLTFLARQGQRIVDWLGTAAGCVDSGSVEGCAVNVVTHGAYEMAGRGTSRGKSSGGAAQVVEAEKAPATRTVQVKAPGAVRSEPVAQPALAAPRRQSLGAAAADDPALLADDSPLTLYRSMKPGVDGQPATGTSGRTLGARPGAPPSGDIPVTDGLVHPDTGGMSVTPNDPAGLPPHRRPPGMGGTGKDPVYCITEACLGERLKYRPDPDKPNTHGFIEPREPLALEEYLKALSDTAGSWKKVE